MIKSKFNNFKTQLFIIILVLPFIFYFYLFSNENNIDYNLDFEQLEKQKAKGWFMEPNDSFTVQIDKEIYQSGKHSLNIKSINNNYSEHFKKVDFFLNGRFQGKKLKLTGYLKTENVKNGWAGLWMRVDPKVAFDNMIDRPLKGTNDWQQYTIELDINNTIIERIAFGGLLAGEGQIWIDNFNITIDDKVPKEQVFSLNTTHYQLNYMDDYNLDFEFIKNQKPVGWLYYGLPYDNKDYSISVDNKIFQHGKHSILIENQSSNHKPDDKSWISFTNYIQQKKIKGKEIKFIGYIKTENVRNGFAGLWMKIEPDVLTYHMEDRGVIGTTEWQKYEMAFKINPDQIKTIQFGGWLQGKGKAWFDNFEIRFDDKIISQNDNDNRVYHDFLDPLNENKKKANQW